MELLERQAHTLEGMGNGHPSQLYERIEDAYMLCDRERVRMQERCGHDESGNPEREAGRRRNGGSR